MSIHPVIERIGDVGVYRPVSECRFAVAVTLIATAITTARGQGITRLLIDIRGLTGFASPTLSERHLMVREWAQAAGGKVRGVLVTPPGMIDPEKFGVVAAANFGLVGNAFESEDEAMEWLKQLPDQG